MPPAAGRKARFAGKDPQSQSATHADLLYLSSHSESSSSCRGERLFARRRGSPLTDAKQKPKRSQSANAGYLTKNEERILALKRRISFLANRHAFLLPRAFQHQIPVPARDEGVRTTISWNCSFEQRSAIFHNCLGDFLARRSRNWPLRSKDWGT